MPSPIAELCQLTEGQEADFFAMLADKTVRHTKEGLPFLKLVFCDYRRQVSSVLWTDHPLFKTCSDHCSKGQYYKLRAVYQTGRYGPQLGLRKIRATLESDVLDGFDPARCRPASRINADILFEEVQTLARQQIGKGPLQNLIVRIFKEWREVLYETPGSRKKHHAYYGGLLEHTLSVARIAAFLADHYQAHYPETKRIFSKPLTIAGAILHDIGKVKELDGRQLLPQKTLEGSLIGHPILGRDIIRQFGPLVELDSNVQLQLEHIILAHPRFPEHHAPQVPMSLEAIIVHEADYCDCMFASSLQILNQDDSTGILTREESSMGAGLFKGMEAWNTQMTGTTHPFKSSRETHPSSSSGASGSSRASGKPDLSVSSDSPKTSARKEEVRKWPN